MFSGCEFMLMASGDLCESDMQLMDEMEGVKSIQRRYWCLLNALFLHVALSHLGL